MNPIKEKIKSYFWKNQSLFLVIFFASLLPLNLSASDSKSYIYGKVKDQTTGEGLAYVYIIVPGTTIGTTTDMEGNYQLSLREGKYTVKVSYMLYQPEEIPVEIHENEVLKIDVELVPDVEVLNTVTVRSTKMVNTEEFIIAEMKEARNVVSGISSGQISRTQDNNASEVIRRIPGVTLIDGRFIAVRGLSQRYNNVWINNGIAPGAESDSRAFSFDFIPSSMIENILVYKNLSPELPADFSGGFVKVTTKDLPVRNQISLSYGTGFRTHSVFRKHFGYSYSAGDALGLGSIKRNLPSSFPENLNGLPVSDACALTRDLNGEWKLKRRTAIPNQSLSFSFNNIKKLSAVTMGQTAYVSYSYQNDIQTLQNNSYGIYNIDRDESSFSRQYADTQYVAEVKTTMGYNLSFLDSKSNKIAFKNLVQNTGKDVVTLRDGINYSNNYIERSREFLYRNRLTYATQLEGAHQLKKDTNRINWTVGYSFLRNNEPDRRIMDARMDQNEGSPYYGRYKSMDNDIRRYFQKLNEHAVSTSLNYEHQFEFNNFKPSLQTGLYGEYKNRGFNARNFTYKKGIDHNLPPEYFYLPYEEMMDPAYIRPDGFFLVENTGKADSYRSSSLIDAAYFSVNLPFSGIILNGGLRFEHRYLTLDSYESDGIKPVNIRQHQFHLFPAANLSYSINDKHIFRAIYGKTVNRPEFREIAPYVYYDFESFSYVEGNPDLKNALIHNLDFRYEYYPASNEMISFGGFYKKFINPIENTYYDAGGQLQYTFMNAHSAYSYGIELDIRKSLDFMKLKNLSLVLNASLIKSAVIFPEESMEMSRPMQGQSPYIINMGLFYENPKWDLNFSLLYNVIGKRITAVGQTNQNANENIPHTYEMPRHSLDATIQKKFGKVTVSLGAKNILNQKVVFSQIGEYTVEGEVHTYSQNTKVMKPGVQLNANVSIKIN